MFYGGQARPGQDEAPWWDAPGKVPLNAPVTVVGDTAYLLDAAGNLHAVGLPNAG